MLDERFLLIPIIGSFPDIRRHLDEHPEDTEPDAEETLQMGRLAIDFVISASVLERYWKALIPYPEMN